MGLRHDSATVRPGISRKAARCFRTEPFPPIRYRENEPINYRVYAQDLRLKEQALARTIPLGVKPARYRPDDQLLAFLESL